MENVRRRDLTLDLVKGIAMILVIMVHNAAHLDGESVLDMVAMTLAQGAIPCFFMAAGAVYLNGPAEKESWEKTGRRRHLMRIFRFYLQLSLWKALYLLIYHQLGAPLPGNRELLTYLFLFGDVPGVNTAHFWFMEAYITILLIAPVLKELYDSRQDLFLYLTGMLFLFQNGLTALNLAVRLFCQFVLEKEPFLLGGLAEVNPLHFQYSFCIFYYMAGALLYRKRKEIPVRTAAAALAAGIIGLILIRYSQYETFRWRGSMVVSGHFWISTFLMAGGAFLLITRREKLPGPAAFFAKLIGQNTEMIFYLHMPMLAVMDRVLYPGLAPFDGLILSAAECLLIACAAALVSISVKKISGSLKRRQKGEQ